MARLSDNKLLLRRVSCNRNDIPPKNLYRNPHTFTAIPSKRPVVEGSQCYRIMNISAVNHVAFSSTKYNVPRVTIVD